MKQANNTKENIIEAATRLFSQQGYDATTIRQIVSAAGVSQPSLYWAFENKKALLDEILNIYLSKLKRYQLSKEEADELIDTVTPMELLERCMTRFHPDDTEFMYLVVRIIHMEQFTNPLARDILIGQLRDETKNSLKYVLTLLLKRGDIPKCNIEYLAEVWSAAMLQDSITWVTYIDENGIENAGNFTAMHKQIINVILKGNFDF